MPAGLGLHPYFADRDDCLLAGVVQTHWPAGADSIPARPEPVPADLPLDGSRPLPRGVDVGFGGWAGQAALASAAGGWRVMMTGDALFSHLMVYTPTGRGFFVSNWLATPSMVSTWRCAVSPAPGGAIWRRVKATSGRSHSPSKWPLAKMW